MTKIYVPRFVCSISTYMRRCFAMREQRTYKNGRTLWEFYRVNHIILIYFHFGVHVHGMLRAKWIKANTLIRTLCAKHQAHETTTTSIEINRYLTFSRNKFNRLIRQCTCAFYNSCAQKKTESKVEPLFRLGYRRIIDSSHIILSELDRCDLQWFNKSKNL